MTASRTILALAAAAALGSGLAWSPLAQAQSGAQSGAAAPMTSAPSPSAAAPCSHASSRAQAVKPRSDAQVEARITHLHKELKITQDQESDWNALAQDMRDNARQMSGLLAERASAGKSKPMNAVDNLKSYEKITDAHAEGLKKITPDFEKLYNEMSPSQKKTADTVFNQRVNQRVRTTATPSSRSHS
jgi:uncharacterized membrane-anchored protein YhcB (DUF1043 family)